MEEVRPGEIATFTTRSLAHEEVDKTKRYSQIINILTGGKEMTAKEIAVEMWNRGYIPTSERNFSHPRISELLRKGVMECVGKKKCKYTNKTVAVFKLREGQLNIYEYLLR